ncbi:transformer-2 protein homolog alpha-like isoform X6 [Dreissena polymorpha]|uniref:transformer-2 protein homolog alpha-like isoform X4 n=1 Tax=Dreissena polymorpha TaxID=45954 RepID=UPI002263F779|nr:transformer-2 protein homolog alpha-like isoform X4 [Dreissena polymorpha]XP_052246102.1 transformer-2 protein homolog alpha-like isoform X4 [Dreissena polymorpha]XP_052246104.1 transformer-2 protein homolog alpha-like isoform X6 [Dreissena polymorpha]
MSENGDVEQSPAPNEGSPLRSEGSAPPRSKSRSASRSRSRSRSHRHSHSHKRKRSYSRSRSRSHPSKSPRRSRHSRSRSRDRHGSRKERSRSRSPMSSRRRHDGNRNCTQQDDPEPSKCLGIFGLSLYTQERDLREVFNRYGELEEVNVVYDRQSGRSRGFAFIYFRSIDDAIEAKDRCTGLEIDGRRIRVDYSITRRAHTPTPGVYLGKPTSRRERHEEGRYDDRYYGGGGGGGGGDRGGYYGGGGDRGYSGSRRRSPSPYYGRSRRSPSPYYGRKRGYSYSRSRSRSYSRGRYNY